MSPNDARERPGPVEDVVAEEEIPEECDAAMVHVISVIIHNNRNAFAPIGVYGVVLYLQVAHFEGGPAVKVCTHIVP